MGRLMHNGVPWTGEGHPPDSAERAGVLGVTDETPVCTCLDLEWTKEGHHPDCPVRQPAAVKSVVGGEGDPTPCTCDRDWKGEGHAKTCARRQAVVGATGPVCTCRTLKWDGEGHSPDCATKKPVEAEVLDEQPKRRKKE